MAPRRRESQRCPSIATRKATGAPISPNVSCAPRLPPLRPSHAGRQTSATNAVTMRNGRSRIRRSGAIQPQLSGIRVSTTRVAVPVEAIELDIFYDYTCPFVYRAAETIELVRASGQRQVRVNWRYFSLVQVNSREPSWSVWEASGAQAVHGRLAFASAEAARRQGGFDRFHLALLRARHRDGRDIDDVRVVEEVATQAGLDLRRFRDDIAAGDVLEQLKRDHTAARDRHGVF